jgi:tetratricopeptide (TPR) repeat protein
MASRTETQANGNAALVQLRLLANAPEATAEDFESLARLCLERGLIDEAAAASEQAIARDPSRPESWHWLGIAQMQRQNFQAARDALEQVVRLCPQFPPGLNNLGFALQHAGLNAMAADRYRQALSVDPAYVEAYSNLASVLALAGCYDEALAHARRAIAINPRFVSPYIHAAFIETDRERFDEALAWIARLPHEARRDASILIAHAEILVKASRHEDALKVCHEAIAVQPDSGEAFLCLGTALAPLGRRTEALAAFDRAEALMPASAVPLAWKGSVLTELARMSEAKELFDRACALETRLPNVLYMRAAANEFRMTEAEVAGLEEMLADERTVSPMDRTQLHFMLSAAYLRSGDTSKVFPHLHAGNRIKRRMIDYDADKVDDYVSAIAAAFPSSLIRKAAGHESRIPIFVAGIPRSGTTLVEQILASHPKIHGAGELGAMTAMEKNLAAKHRRAYPYFAEDLQASDQRAAGLEYLATTGQPPTGKQHIVDKMPANALFAGLIHLMLPNARMILCQRNPFDTCFSCYSTLFAGRQNFSYDLKELGRYYRAHDALMRHWRRVLPEENFFVVDYEDLVEDIEGVARRLIDFCGLDWSDDCLRFYESTRPVRTASMLQVRKPLYRSSIGRWRPFRAELKPLFETLAVPVPD